MEEEGEAAETQARTEMFCSIMLASLHTVLLFLDRATYWQQYNVSANIIKISQVITKQFGLKGP